MKGIYLLLGSNLGDRQKILGQAIDLINKNVGKVIQESSIYETEAWGFHDQPPFINQIVEIETTLPPQKILSQILDIEKQLGRKRFKKWRERTIDIDILYIGNLVIEEPSLQVPHPHLHKRKFTLIPMVELAPSLVHPILKHNQKMLLEKCMDTLKVNQIEKEKALRAS